MKFIILLLTFSCAPLQLFLSMTFGKCPWDWETSKSQSVSFRKKESKLQVDCKQNSCDLTRLWGWWQEQNLASFAKQRWSLWCIMKGERQPWVHPERLGPRGFHGHRHDFRCRLGMPGRREERPFCFSIREGELPAWVHPERFWARRFHGHRHDFRCRLGMPGRRE